MAASVANPLFNAPPVYTIDAEAGTSNNLHDLLEPWQFLVFGLAAVIIAVLISIPVGIWAVVLIRHGRSVQSPALEADGRALKGTAAADRF